MLLPAQSAARTGGRRTERPRFHLTRAKRTVLAILAEYFCLRTKDVARLLRNREPNGNDLRTARRSLQLLWKERIVNRLPYFELDRSSGGIGYVYGLSDKGLGLCEGGAKSFDEHSARTLDHELEISLFHIAVKRFADANGLRLYWQQSDLKRGIHPDALFALTDPKKPETASTYYFFIEIEKSKIGNVKNGEPSIIRKLGRYAEYYDTDQCETDWNFRRFRVIIVQRAQVRRENLLRALSEKFPHRMFWLTTEELYKRDIGGPIFATPRDYSDRTYSLLFE